MTDTEKRESVIRGLECCILADPDSKPNCEECPYNHKGIITNAPCSNGLMVQALALLKGQEDKTVAEEEPQGKPYEDDPDAEEAAQRLTEVLSQAGVPLLEASDAAGKWILMLQEEITKQLSTEESIRLIRMNPNLNWFEKRRIIRGIRKAARHG